MDAAGIFHTLSHHYRETGNYRRADEFYIREARCLHRAQPWQKRCTVGFLNQVLWGYGAMPWRLLAWIAALVILFALLFCLIGIRGADGVSHSPLQGLALSLITFGTLGYGNRVPASLWGEFWAGVESVVSMVLVAMFIVSLARKYVRG